MTSSTSNSDAAPVAAAAATGVKPYTWGRFFRQLLGVVVVFAVVNVVIYNTNQYFQKEQHYHEIVDTARNRPAARLLFAGDSHFAQPLNSYFNENPQSIAYSVAYGGDSARELFAKIRRVLETNPKIDTLVLTADAHMFGVGRVDSSNRSFADRYFLAQRDRTGLPNGWVSTILDFVPLFNDDFVQYLRKTASVGFSGRKGDDEGGGAGAAADDKAPPKINRWALLSDEARAAKARQVGEMDHQGVGEHTEPFYWYTRILQLARDHDVRVIGARFPVHAQYSAQIEPARQERIDRFLFDQGMSDIVDLTDGLTDPQDFDDPDHVNQNGALKVLEMLAPRLPHPVLANVPSAP